jgi:hypothetical protein
VPDAFNQLIRDFAALSATADIGALDEEQARKLSLQEFGSAVEPLRVRDGAVIRPSLSATTDRLRAAIDRATDSRIKQVIDTRRTMTGETILGEVGEMLAEEVRDAIDNNTPPPLAASTLAARRRRGNFSTRTLVDTGKMRLGIGVRTVRGVDGFAGEE